MAFVLSQDSGIGPLTSEARQLLMSNLAPICVRYLENISWYYRKPKALVDADVMKIAVAAGDLQKAIERSTPHARAASLRKPSDGIYPMHARLRQLNDILTEIIDLPGTPREAKRGAREKTFLTEAVPAIVQLWVELTGERFKRTVTTARGKRDELDFGAPGAHFVFGLLNAMDDTVTVKEVRTVIKSLPAR